MSYLLRGSVTVTNEVEVKNDLNNPLRVTIENGPTSPALVEITNPSEFSGNVVASFAQGATDAFGRLRVSNPFTLFESQHRYVENDKWDTSTTSGGSKSLDANASLVNMNVNTASGAQVIRETKRVMPYQPGKSLLIYSTFTMNSPKTNLRQRVGYFTTGNGIYFEVVDNTVNFVLRSTSSGVLSETRVSQASWSVDKLNGNGPSGITLTNFSYSLILFIDIEWLGVGDVRIGFVLNGSYVHCHTFEHTPAGVSPITGTYMTTACLPLRYEITNTGVTASSSTLKQICSSVISEAGYEGFTRRYNVTMDTTPRRLTTSDTYYPILSIRMASTRLDSIIVPSNISALVLSNQIAVYRILLNATLTSPSWVTHYNGNVEYDISATGYTGGTDIIGGYVQSQGLLTVSSVNDFNFQLGRTIAGVSDVLTLVMASNSSNVDVLADLSWFEII